MTYICNVCDKRDTCEKRFCKRESFCMEYVNSKEDRPVFEYDNDDDIPDFEP